MNFDPEQQRLFAIDVVQRLRGEGFVAYWAGGCVRDQLLQRRPKDYDVATNATPPQISHVFGRRKTLQVGAAFGVVVVIGGPLAGQIDVATFRHDVGYSDGRRPDQVVFSDPQQDALRRDFTINGLFYDPIVEQVIDYVGGQEDLRRRVVRAIGDPRARFTEDKLRMLRAVRFASVLNFELETATAVAAAEMARQITVVSAERIAQEMRAMLTHRGRAVALELLYQLGLLAEILPEALIDELAWRRGLQLLDLLQNASFECALAGLFWFAPANEQPLELTLEQVARRWRLSNKELERIVWLTRHRQALVAARDMPWPRLQRLLISPGIEDLLTLHEAADNLLEPNAMDNERTVSARPGLHYCREQLQRPAEELNPPPLLTGDDLLNHGVTGGPRFKTLLEQVRDAQLDGQIATLGEAIALVERLLTDKSA